MSRNARASHALTSAALSAKRSSAAVFFAGALLYAPYQCVSPPERSLREETPGEAVYGFAQKMKADGDENSYRSALRYIVARYPSSRYAAAARLELGRDASDVDAP